MEHYEYLADGKHSSTEDFLKNLLSVIGSEGTVLAYNKTFEATCLKALLEEYPKYSDAIENILDRLVDLMAPFRKNYRLPQMQGSFSIKYVLPALVPELSYSNLTIGNGGDASAAFYNLTNTTDENDLVNTRKALLEYCKMDTLAMVRVLEVLKDK